MEVAIVVVALIVYLAFRQWLVHHRRMMIHRERLAAVEKGVDLPPLETEIRRSNFNVQRVLLLAGLVWISIGVGVFITLSAVLAYPSELTKEIPRGLQWIGVAPVSIGLSHLIVYWAGRNKERR
jgi:hypothetical protein